MKLYFKIILFNYLKYFLILFLSIDALFLGIDLLLNYTRIPDENGYFIRYVFYTSISAITYILPICIILALLLSKFSMIKNNELIVFYSLGISKKMIVLPNFLCAALLVCVYLTLNFTEFAYAYEYKNNIIKDKILKRNIQNIFFTSDDNIIYIEKYEHAIIKNVEISKIKDGKIINQIIADYGRFDGKKWILENVKIKNFLNPSIVGEKSISIKYEEEKQGSISVKPEVFKGLSLQDELSIKDAFYLYKLLKSQNLDTTRVRAILYGVCFLPFFAPMLMVIIFYYLPNMRRYGDFTLVSLALILFALLSYGVLLFLSRLGLSGAVYPEISTLLPVLILCLTALRFYYKKS